jgi:hypothetical protein
MQETGIPIIETSAKTAFNVDKAFIRLTTDLIKAK